MIRIVLAVCSLFFLSSAPLLAQTTLTAETSNNTAACSAAGSPSYCQGAFTGMSSASSGIYNPAPGNINNSSLSSLLYSGNTTKIFAYFQPWFCMNPGSTATGNGTSCNGHRQVGYNSNDASTVAGQTQDMIARGFSGVIVDWYGPNKAIENGTTLKVRDNLNPRCNGFQNCPLLFSLIEEQGSWTAACPTNGGGVDQTNCIIQHLNSDLDYMDSNYFGAPSYLKVDRSTLQPSSLGAPVIFFFICEECFTNPAPSWSTIWNQVRTHAQGLSNGNPIFIFRNAGGFTHTQTDGAFAWVGWYGSNDPYGLVYLNNFYDTSISYPARSTWGAAWKGFDDTNAPWVGSSPRVMQQQCGQTWLQTMIAETHNSDYSVTRQLPFSGAVTWNDYEEGTEIETGISNCLGLSASVSGSILSWNLSFSAASGSENTVDHYIVFDSADGQNLTPKATLLPGTHAVDLNTLTLASGNHILYVKAVGKPSIQNQMSNAVTYTVGSAPPPTCTDFSLTANPASLTLTRGSSGTSQISLSSSCGYTGTVSFTVSLGPTALKGISATVNPTSASGPTGGTVLTVSVGGKPQTGTGTVIVTATDSSLSKSASASIALTVK